MAYTLKTSGLALKLVMCVAVDEDGTIKEFVSSTVNSNKTLGTGVAASVATGSWKGTARKYWSSTNNGGFDYHGVKFASGSRPTLALNVASGWTLWEAYHAVNTPFNLGGLISYNTTDDAVGGSKRSTGGKLTHNMSSGDRGTGTTTIPADNSTKYSAGFSFLDGTGEAFYYGLESGSLAADGTSTAGNGFAGGNGTVYGIGGFETQGCHPASRYCSCLFNDDLTLTEMQSLHNDWFGTLFDAPVASDVTGAGAIASAEAFGTAVVAKVNDVSAAGAITSAEAIGTHSVSSGTVGNITSAGNISSGEAFGTTVVSSIGTVTLQPVNNTNTALNSITFDVAVLHATTLASVTTLTNQTASAGNLVLTSSLLVPGTSYNFVLRRTDTGKLGCILATAS